MDNPPSQSREPADLPPAEPPSPSFLWQLFLVPLLIVTIIIMVWLMFSWLAHMGSDPERLVRNLRKNNDAGWQSALTLADLLRNPDHEELKQNPQLAGDLVDVLRSHMDAADVSPNSIRLRVFLCRALGEFSIPDVVPILITAAGQQRDEAELDVRRAAVEAIAVFAARHDVESLRDNQPLVDALLAASRERTSDASDLRPDELRSTAAFALGVVGGERAVERLAVLAGDPYPNARYNATTALARQGDLRALPGLLEMLDAGNLSPTRSESEESARLWKQVLILRNGIRAAVVLVEKQPQTALTPIRQALEDLQSADLSHFPLGVRQTLRMDAAEALQHITE
jgi:HEAT repeat protein